MVKSCDKLGDFPGVLRIGNAVPLANRSPALCELMGRAASKTSSPNKTEQQSNFKLVVENHPLALESIEGLAMTGLPDNQIFELVFYDKLRRGLKSSVFYPQNMMKTTSATDNESSTSSTSSNSGSSGSSGSGSNREELNFSVISLDSESTTEKDNDNTENQTASTISTSISTSTSKVIPFESPTTMTYLRSSFKQNGSTPASIAAATAGAGAASSSSTTTANNASQNPTAPLASPFVFPNAFHPYHWLCHWIESWCSIANKEFALAVAELNFLKSSFGLSTQLQSQLGFCLLQLGHNDDAMIAFEKVQKIDPHCVDSVHFLAKSYFKLGNFNQINEIAQKAVISNRYRAEPWIAVAKYNEGVAWQYSVGVGVPESAEKAQKYRQVKRNELKMM